MEEKSHILIGVSGKKRSGKDTVGDHLVEKYGFTKMSFAEPLKRGVIEFFGLAPEQVYDESLKNVPDKFWKITPRVMLQLVGTDCMRKAFPEGMRMLKNHHPWFGTAIWCQRLKKELLDRFNIERQKIIVTDVRFEDEARMLQEIGGKVIRIERELNDPMSDQHESETALDRFSSWDGILSNTGTIAELQGKIVSVLHYLNIDIKKEKK